MLVTTEMFGLLKIIIIVNDNRHAHFAVLKMKA